MKYIKSLLTLAAVATFAPTAFAQTTKSGAITADETWGGAANPSPIILEDSVRVNNGATLTILAGTVVRGQPREGAVGNNNLGPGSLVITQNGRLIAVGEDDNPIIFTTAALDANNDGEADDIKENAGSGNGFLDQWEPADGLGNFLDSDPATAPLAPLDGAGEATVQLWGGLVVLGNAPTNLGANTDGLDYGTATVEGLVTPTFPIVDATYGGVNPNDSSGNIQFISVRHGGDEIGTANEINGITLAGVGSGTIFQNNEVYMNFDDGIEWFGGTVNSKNLVVVFAGDDQFDVDQGFTGKNQFWLGVLPFFNAASGDWGGGSNGDEGFEFDGDDSSTLGGRSGDVNLRDDPVGTNVADFGSDATPWPLSYPIVYNATIIGGRPDFGSASTEFTVSGGDNGRMLLRNGFCGEIWNSVSVNTGQAGVDVDVGDRPVGGHAFEAPANAAAGLIVVGSTIFDGGAALDADTLDALANGNTAVANNVSLINRVNPGTVGPFGWSGLLNEDQTFDPSGDANGQLVASLKATPLNPRLPTGAIITNANSALGFEAANYRGAFSSNTGVELWTTGWTVLNVSGLMVD